jgi:hypothetical protein
MSPLRRPHSPFARRRSAVAVVAVTVAALLAGCGVGAGTPAADTRLTITRDFGHVDVQRLDDPASGGADTAMRLLQRNAETTTRFGGGFVQSVNGVAGGMRDGRTVDWFYFVNGVAAEEGATSYELRKGDHVWWDHRDWSVTANVPAVVGAYPEPFVHGIEGKRLPIRVECPIEENPACDAVRDRLVQAGVVPGSGGLRTSLAQETIRVIVGPWSAVRADQVARRIEQGPATSGVYGRMAADGRSLDVLDERGEVTRTLRAGTGLVAATRIEDEAPVWVVTGTDEAGLRAAVGALTEARLDRAFAYVATAGGGVKLPEITPPEGASGGAASP